MTLPPAGRPAKDSGASRHGKVTREVVLATALERRCAVHVEEIGGGRRRGLRV